MTPLLDGLYIYHKTPTLSWKELRYGLNKRYIDERGVSRYASEILTLDSCDKQVELASLNFQDLFNAHELLNSLAQDSKTTKDPSKIWIYILLSWLFENKHNYIDPFEIIDEIYADFGYPEEISTLVRYMPATEDSAKSENQLVRNWEKFLSSFEQEQRKCI